MKAALQNYQARMRRVLDYIDRHLSSMVSASAAWHCEDCRRWRHHPDQDLAGSR